jgi:hypothetical protein
MSLCMGYNHSFLKSNPSIQLTRALPAQMLDYLSLELVTVQSFQTSLQHAFNLRREVQVLMEESMDQQLDLSWQYTVGDWMLHSSSETQSLVRIIADASRWVLSAFITSPLPL